MGRMSKRVLKQEKVEVPSENYLYYLSALCWDHKYGNQSHCEMLQLHGCIAKDPASARNLNLTVQFLLQHSKYASFVFLALRHMILYSSAVNFKVSCLWTRWSCPPLLPFPRLKILADLKVDSNRHYSHVTHMKERQMPECLISLSYVLSWFFLVIAFILFVCSLFFHQFQSLRNHIYTQLSTVSVNC